MTITRKDIAAHLERQVRTGFLQGVRGYVPLRSAFTRETGSDGAFESYTDMGATPWPVENAGKGGPGGTDTRTGSPIAGQMSEGGAVTILGGEEKGLIVYNRDFEVTIGLEHNAIDDDRTGDLEAWALGAGTNFQRHMDSLCFDALNSGEATTKYGPGYDNLSFFNNSHVDPGALYTTAQDNLYTVTLSLDNFETVKVAGSKFRMSNGQAVGLTHRLLVVPPDLERIAAQIAMNREAYDTANREINPYSGSVTYLVAPGGWLDTTAWFLIDNSQIQKPVNLQLRKAPALVIWDDETQGSGIRYYKWHARYQVFYGDWRLAIQGNS